jgi:ribosomal protein S18 acetylase RimI-like enzyme
MAGLQRERRTERYHKASLWGMYVQPARRRRGIGRALLQAVVGQARKLPGVRQVHLEVTETNQAACALYESSGFVRYGLETDAFRIADDFYNLIYMAMWIEGGT